MYKVINLIHSQVIITQRENMMTGAVPRMKLAVGFILICIVY